jgi:hypothetical protein
MNKLMDEIKQYRNVKDSTIKLYKSQLNKLSIKINGKPFRSRQFLLKKHSEILTYLETLSSSQRRIMISAILVAISPRAKDTPQNKNFNKVYKKYNLLLKDENKVYNDSVADNKKTEKDDSKWVDWKTIIAGRDKMEEEIKCLGYNSYTKQLKNQCDKIKILNHLILSLYTYLPPRRLEYANMILYPQSSYSQLNQSDRNNYIYYVLKPKKSFIHYGKNTTKSPMDNDHVFEVPEVLNAIVKRYVKLNDVKFGTPLIRSIKNKALSTNLFGKQIQKLFLSEFKSEGGVGILRKSYLSNKYGSGILEKNEDAQMMNHSVGVQQSIYTKV